MCAFQELIDDISVNCDRINKDAAAVKLFRLIFSCEKNELLTTDRLLLFRKKLKNNKLGVGYYVPTDNKI
jgi:hypothetical protein